MKTKKIDKSYFDVLNNIKQKIITARIRAALSVNAEMVLLYWEIGKTILEQQKNEGWGTKVIDRLAKDLRSVFPEMKGCSARNLKYMRKFANTFTDFTIVQAVLAQITWYHNIALLDKIDSREEYLWYAKKIVENGWSRNVLVHQIESNLYQRQSVTTKTTNFKNTLLAPQSDLAQEIIKDPYKFDFLTINEEVKELELEQALTSHITKFLLELGTGFAFIGRQYHLEIAEKDYFLDLLFYHVKLRCYVTIELKIGEFKPEYAGKMNFYLSAIDDLLKTKDDNPSIGIILCKTKDKPTVEYALRDITKPVGVSEYKLSNKLPAKLRKDLPTIEAVEKELDTFDLFFEKKKLKT